MKDKPILFEVLKSCTFKRCPQSPRSLLANQASAAAVLPVIYATSIVRMTTILSYLYHTTAGLMRIPDRKDRLWPENPMSLQEWLLRRRTGKSGPAPFPHEAFRKLLTKAGSMLNADHYLLHCPLTAPLPRLFSTLAGNVHALGPSLQSEGSEAEIGPAIRIVTMYLS